MRRVVSTSFVVLLLVAAACGDADEDASPDGATATTSASTTTEADGADGSTTTTADAGADEVVALEVVAGEVVGGARDVSVAVGAVVRIVVTADVDDEIHVHGYDLVAPTAPGRPGQVTFTADLAGQWEVELEDAGLLLVSLTVS